MKKFLKAALAFAMVATLATGCGAKANYAKAGLGVVSSYSDGQVNTTMVALGLDGDGKIQYIDLDVAQSTPGGDAEYDQTKEERGDAYGMKGYSASLGNIENGGEWYEQAEAFETWCKGKTPDEVANSETTTNDHGTVSADADLYAGCTIQVSDFLAAVAKAAANAVEVEADTIVLGRNMSNDSEAKKLNTDIVLLAKDADGKVVYAKWDVAQIYEGVTDTKSELKEGYNMGGTSPIGKEWYEQAAAFEDFCNGKTVEEIAAVETMDYHGGKAAKTGTDLAAGCTITLDGPLAAIAKAK